MWLAKSWKWWSPRQPLSRCEECLLLLVVVVGVVVSIYGRAVFCKKLSRDLLLRMVLSQFLPMQPSRQDTAHQN